MAQSHPVHLLCPIDVKREEIRLFNLLPGQWDAPIRCSFAKISLADNDHVAYTALSYVWGEKLDKFTILVDDLDFTVTRNLFLALRRIRAHMAGQPSTLWADALCIDQANVTERNQQVKLMGKIYRKCREAIFWMGEMPPFIHPDGNPIVQELTESDALQNCYEINEDDRDTDSHEYTEFVGPSSTTSTTTSPSDLARHVAWFLRELSRGAHMSDLPPFSPEIYNHSTYFSIFQQTVDFLCLNSWFDRLWVIQEAVLAPSARIFYGSVSVPLDMLVRARKVLDSHMPSTCCLSSGPGHYPLRASIRNFLIEFASIQWLRDERRADRLSKPLLELCLTFSSRQTSLSVDRIYALNGLAPAKCFIGALVPDYDLAPDKLYEQVSRDYITGTSSLLPLMFSSMKARYSELPSWAIDWSIFDQESQVKSTAANYMMDVYQFNGFSEGSPVRFDGHCLLTGGFICDFVTEVIEAIPQSEDWGGGAWHGNWLELVSKDRSPEHAYPPLSTQSWNEAWLRTLCGDLCYGQNSARRVNKLDIDFFSAMLPKCHPSIVWQTRKMEPRFAGEFLILENGREVPADAHLNDLLMMMRIATTDKKLFLTKKGYLGIGNRQTSLGDQIAILSGAYTPLILRPVESHAAGSTSQESVFRVVSEGYVHGLMDGEAVLGGNPMPTTIAIA